MDIMAIVKWVQENWLSISKLIAAVIGVASIVVKLTPTLRDDNMLLPIVKFVGKYIALNKSVSNENRPQ